MSVSRHGNMHEDQDDDERCQGERQKTSSTIGEIESNNFENVCKVGESANQLPSRIGIEITHSSRLWRVSKANR